ncbi:hypothetical protein QVA66_06380 [Staphylococcus chromogenes]|nr:hypothetical protein [Staphylococcus chromogenes]
MYDAAAVRFFDIAHEGARLRAVAGVIPDLREETVRSLVVVTGDHMSRRAAELAIAASGPARFPMSVCAELPPFVGPLDLVVVATARGADPVLEQALSQAASRGAAVFLVAPGGCPLAEDASTRVQVLPGLPTSTATSPSQIFGTVYGLVTSTACGAHCAAEELELIAHNVDDELTRVAPDRDASVNLAANLNEFVQGARIIHTAAPGFGALADFMASYWTSAGLVSASLSLTELQEAYPRLNDGAADIFYDPFEDEAPAVLPLKIVVWGAAEAGLPGAIAQDCAPSAESEAIRLLRLLVRGLAVTAIV